MAKKKPTKKAVKPGPKADVLKIDGMDWEVAMKKSLAKKKPPGGWPKPVDEETKVGKK